MLFKEETETFEAYITLSHDASLVEKIIIEAIREELGEPSPEYDYEEKLYTLESTNIFAFNIDLPIGKYSSEEIGDRLWESMPEDIDVLSIIITSERHETWCLCMDSNS